MRSDWEFAATGLTTSNQRLSRGVVCDIRTVESDRCAEIYLTAVPTPGPAARQAAELYGELAGVLRDMGATIVAERLIGCSDAFPAALCQRQQALQELDDGVDPSLVSDRSGDGRLIGVQVHAVRGVAKPTLWLAGGRPLARSFAYGGRHLLSGTGLRRGRAGEPHLQARDVFLDVEALLGQAGATLADLARTWIWVRDILAWYPRLNEVRNGLFGERGLLDGAGRVPASTGIGIAPPGAHIAVDFVAAWGSEDAVRRLDAAGNQRSAREYGSAFARAACVRTPAGTTVYCSGTAAIDGQGRTCFVGDIPGQVAMTLENTAAVLRDTGCGDGDVVQAMAYCATPEVAAHFVAHHRAGHTWPCLVLIGDVCRNDLLFEVEVTACRSRASE